MNEITDSDCCPPRQHSRLWAGVLAAAAAGIAVLVAACGGSSGSSASPAAPSHPPGYQQYHAYSRCMRSHGAPFWPEPSQINNGVFDNPNTYKIAPKILTAEHGPRWQAALRACRKLAPPQLPFTATQISALRSELVKLAGCMRTHGITHFPSPVVSPSGGGFPSPGPGVSPDSAQFQAAQRACWIYAPGPRRKGGMTQ
jgi:hypothetical protein